MNQHTAALSNKALLAAVRALCFFRSGAVLARINYRDMDTEELGSVYESLLELQPALNVDANPWRFGFIGDEAEGEARGSARKLTGSYYTPDELVQELIKSALEPKISEALKANDPRSALLALKVIDPASGSGHFLLAAARRIAADVARLDAESDVPEAQAFRHALREVVSRCIYGVDLNPLAVELCQTALWLETLEPGKPLGFLDHHVRHGNSLIGILDSEAMKEGIPDAAYTVLTGDDKQVCNSLKKRNTQQFGGRQSELFRPEPSNEFASTHRDLEAMPEDTVEAIAAKRAAFSFLEASDKLARERARCDLFCAAFFAPKSAVCALDVPLSEDLIRVADGQSLRDGVTSLTKQLVTEHHFFHWRLAFPEVFAAGGFDVVLANPPWEVSQLNEEEYFARHLDNLSTLSGNKRKQAVAALEKTNPNLWARYILAKRGFDATNLFCRETGRYPLTGSGKLNLYALFAECITKIIKPSGRAGFIVPTGIATDELTKNFFESLVSENKLHSLFDFENREKLFKAIDSRLRFCAITLGKSKMASYVFFATRVEHLRDTRRIINLSADEISTLNPNTKTVPTFRSIADADLMLKITGKFGVFHQQNNGNPWGENLSRIFNMGASAEQILAESSNVDDSLPIYEAKHFHQFDHRYSSASGSNGEGLLKDTEKSDVNLGIKTLNFMSRTEIERRLNIRGAANSWLVCYRDITNATNERTVIAAILPRYATNYTIRVCIVSTPPATQAALVANMNSLVFDYCARQKLAGNHISDYIFRQLPVIPATNYSQKDLEFIVPRVIELTYTAVDLVGFARDLGYMGAPFVWNSERRSLLRAELDAFYAKLYGLTRDELRYILDPADIYGDDYPSETFRGLKNNEIRQFGEYRTRRLVLEAWDRLAGP
jgi:N-6 DNA Methylase